MRFEERERERERKRENMRRRNRARCRTCTHTDDRLSHPEMKISRLFHQVAPSRGLCVGLSIKVRLHAFLLRDIIISHSLVLPCR